MKWRKSPPGFENLCKKADNMTIYRNGVEIYLTDDELFAAYSEQQARFDRMDVKYFTMCNYNDKEFEDVFGITKEEFRPMLDVVRYVYRRDYCSHDVCEAVHEAAFTVIQRHKNQHNLCAN